MRNIQNMPFKTQISNKFWAGEAERPIKMVADQQQTSSERALLGGLCLKRTLQMKNRTSFFKWAVSTTIDHTSTQI